MPKLLNNKGMTTKLKVYLLLIQYKKNRYTYSKVMKSRMHKINIQREKSYGLLPFFFFLTWVSARLFPQVELAKLTQMHTRHIWSRCRTQDTGNKPKTYATPPTFHPAYLMSLLMFVSQRLLWNP